MKQLLLALSVIIYNTTVAQDTTFYAAVRDAINSTGNTGTIFYTDTAIQFWRYPSHFAKKKTLKGFEAIRGNKQTTLTLTKKELKSLDQQARLLIRVPWTDHVMDNSSRITSDSVIISYNNVGRDWQKERPVHYYYFSQPIYTHNNTILIFRLLDMIGHSAGYDLIFVYQFDQMVWKQKLVIQAGAF